MVIMVEQVMKLLNVEWLYTIVPPEAYYNVSLVVNILSCNKSSSLADHADDTDESLTVDKPQDHDENIGSGFFQNLHRYFAFTSDSSQHASFEAEMENIDPEPADFCDNLISIDGSYQILLFHILTSVLVFLLIFCCFTFLCIKVISKRKDVELSLKTDDGDLDLEEVNEAPLQMETEGPEESDIATNDKDEQEKKDTSPLTVPVMGDKNRKNAKALKSTPVVGELFEATIGKFLKELDRGLEMDDCGSPGGPSMSLPSSASSSTVNSLTSPRLPRRGLHRSRHSNQTFTYGDAEQRQAKEFTMKYWIMYEKFAHRMNWTFPESSLDDVNIRAASGDDDKLLNILQFLYQNSPTSPKQFNVASLIVNYSLFILEQEMMSMSEESSDLVKFVRFESLGSAADGTHVGMIDGYDVMTVLNISHCSELSILHNNLCSDIPSGHVVIGAKPVNGSQVLQDNKCFRKAFVSGFYGFYLPPQQVEDMVEAMLKKAVVKLNREHKSKTDRLPFKVQVSQNKKLTLCFDTRLLQGLGLGVTELNVKCTPSICLSDPSFCLLPPIYAVPSWRADHKKTNGSTSSISGTLGRIFHNQSPDVSTDLLWSLNVTPVESSILQHIENKFSISGVESQHKLCIRVLKALFSEGSKTMLLNKGEISPYIIKSVICFLLLESPAWAWSLENLPDRVSDSVHFLKSSFENVWLPNFIVHNPHLLGQVPSLAVMSALLSGRQQNLLADVSQDAALKVLDYIDARLQKSGLLHCIKAEFSPQMWEYEFFMFG
ncbi:uncharacterized protein LOC101848176 [Aplysia californica]|uniref:Uncharacterized protein LOC101848176 n=1 Tax=Aplysia californica TaxID=6500 RepID=A0ABM0JER9_APLCA|nr:uncharacterized protein LOC101848176 [Aplysia californica]